MNTVSIFDVPHLRPLGRFQRQRAREAGVLPLLWSGSGLELRFTGPELHVLLEADFERLEPWVSVEVNGAPLTRLPLSRGVTDLCLFRGLTAGTPKRVRLLKETQPMPDERSACLRVTGLRWSEGEFLPLPEPAYRLEFVGDSLTSGEGLCGAEEESDFAAAWFSARTAFPRLTADLLSADCHTISQSGWGVRSDWCNDPRHALPDWYEQVCGPSAGEAALGAQEEYDFALWQPDAVVVNLGTNDAGAMDNPPFPLPDGTAFCQRKDPEGLQLLEDAALAFLRKLRRCHPQAKLVWAYGMSGQPLRAPLERAVERMEDPLVWYLPLPEVRPETMGSRLHPGPGCHREAAETLASFLKTIL